MRVITASEAVATAEPPTVGLRCSGAVDLRLVQPDETDLWVARGNLAAGATLTWTSGHGDEAVYVRSGELDVGGVACGPDAGFVVEAGAGVTVTARADTEIVHLGGGVPEASSARRVLVVGPNGSWARVDDDQNVRFFADATSTSCSLWLLYSERFRRHDSRTHSHAQDELIHVLRGELVMGSWRVRPGDTLFVEADRRYRFHSGDDGYAFVNYRSGPSVMTVGRDDPPIVENGASTGMIETADVVVVG